MSVGHLVSEREVGRRDPEANWLADTLASGGFKLHLPPNAHETPHRQKTLLPQ